MLKKQHADFGVQNRTGWINLLNVLCFSEAWEKNPSTSFNSGKRCTKEPQWLKQRTCL